MCGVPIFILNCVPLQKTKVAVMGSARSAQVSTCYLSHIRLPEEMDGCVYTENQNNTWCPQFHSAKKTQTIHICHVVE